MDNTFKDKSGEASVPDQPNETEAGRIPAAIIEWARRQYSEEEIVAGLQEIRTTGGLELVDFIQEIERELTPRE